MYHCQKNVNQIFYMPACINGEGNHFYQQTKCEFIYFYSDDVYYILL